MIFVESAVLPKYLEQLKKNYTSSGGLIGAQ